ncbi:MAG: zinc ribbon domain-containing protein [Pyrinomonadaceae bacterium]|nr:zinc ribbon domain-containing protein [Acidobacteriota bacterium]MBK7935246.1 zinc ribbon domain-containing protein [Acidobacteriota bacterium]MBP7376465.1 zinc ribbon domain-containing protein [Pyrinomonadaceae bacterium]
MAEAVLEKAICAACGVDVREGTQFCYNCGKPVPNGLESTVVPAELSGNADPGSNIENDDKIETNDKAEKLAAAATERKRSRVGQRKPKKVIWEEPGAASNRMFILVCLLITVIAGALVFLMVFMK